MPAAQERRDDRAASWDGGSEDTLARSLAVPATDCIEAGLAGNDETDGAGDGGRSHLGLTVSLQAIYRHGVATTFSNALADRIQLGEVLRDRIHTALHEALLNAVLHGHLRLEAGRRETLGGFEATHETIRTQLASPRFARVKVVIDARWTDLRLQIEVHDGGVGFEPRNSPGGRLRGSGRGLLILEAFCDSLAHINGGSTVIMGFEL